jgi:hypothetical protein
MNPPLLLLGIAGCLGALLLFAADLILYYPADPTLRTARCYFRSIDPNGDSLAVSPMADISEARLMLGGVLGPVAAMLYGLGFLHVYFGLRPEQGAFLPALVAGSFTMTMIVGAVYHALFAYTGFIARALRSTADADGASPHLALSGILRQHQAYLLYTYRWAALPGFVGSLGFIATVLSRDTMYSTASVLLTPGLSAPLKLWLKHHECGDLVLCGGLTNLWNLLFLLTITWTATYP